MKTLHLVNAKDRDGHKNILFCMESNDFRFGTENYEDLGAIKKVGKSFVSQADGRVYKRFADWSMKQISIA